jgi:hypothetical protein
MTTSIFVDKIILKSIGWEAELGVCNGRICQRIGNATPKIIHALHQPTSGMDGKAQKTACSRHFFTKLSDFEILMFNYIYMISEQIKWSIHYLKIIYSYRMSKSLNSYMWQFDLITCIKWNNCFLIKQLHGLNMLDMVYMQMFCRSWNEGVGNITSQI